MDNISKGVIGALSIRNIGGISQEHVELAPGVTVLTGPNATNRTSFLKALAAAQGSEKVALKGNEQSGSVELTLEDETYRRDIRVVNDSLVFEGTCPVNEEHIDAAELFAFLFEQNRAREAIRRGSDLRSVVMEPVDTAAIETEINDLKDQRAQQKRELDDLRSLRQTLPSLRERRDELAEEINRLESDITETEAEIEQAETSVSEPTAEKEELEANVAELRAVESELATVRSKIETTEQSLSQLETDRSQAATELDELATVDESELTEVTTELSRLHEQLAHKESMMSELQSVIQFNKDLIEEQEDGEISASVLSQTQDTDSSSTTKSLVNANEDLVCWTCGAQTTRAQISETLERLQSVHDDLYGERQQLKSRIEEYKDRKRDLESKQDRQATLEETVDDLEAQIEHNQKTVSKLKSEKAELTAEIEDIEAEIEELREAHENELLDQHQALSTLKHEREEAKDEHNSVLQEIADVEAEIARIDDTEAEIDDLTEQIAELRQQVDRIERKATDQFNKHMDAILGMLEYENIERIWLERKEVTEREGRRTVKRSRFDLHVVRQSDDGSTYEDTVAHLSESEREVTGLIFALAGYLVHDVYEAVPFMILDSLEAIDSERIALLINYLRDHADNIVVALLEEDATALDGEYNQVTQLSQTN